MIILFKKRKIEKLFNSLCTILQMNYEEFNCRIQLSEEQAEKINNDDFLKKNLLLKYEKGKFFITTFGLLTSVTNILVNKDMQFLLLTTDPNYNKNRVIGVKLQK